MPRDGPALVEDSADDRCDEPADEGLERPRRKAGRKSQVAGGGKKSNGVAGDRQEEDGAARCPQVVHGADGIGGIGDEEGVGVSKIRAFMESEFFKTEAWKHAEALAPTVKKRASAKKPSGKKAPKRQPAEINEPDDFYNMYTIV